MHTYVHAYIQTRKRKVSGLFFDYFLLVIFIDFPVLFLRLDATNNGYRIVIQLLSLTLSCFSTSLIIPALPSCLHREKVSVRMDPTPIMPSATDLERRRLETTIDQDLHSLSLGSLITTTTSSTSHSNRHSHSPSHSISSMSSIEIPRGFGEGDTGRGTSLMFPSYPADVHGPHGTPRAAVRKASGMSLRSEFDSPVSTAGHHVSAMTLNQGIFRRGREEDSMAGDEFDPERSLGRLVGELGKVMGNVSDLNIRYFEPWMLRPTMTNEHVC